jgi:hypothetical protein
MLLVALQIFTTLALLIEVVGLGPDFIYVCSEKRSAFQSFLRKRESSSP